MSTENTEQKPKRNIKKIIGISTGLFLLIGGGLSFGHYFAVCSKKDKTQDETPIIPSKKTTTVQEKYWDDDLSGFQMRIGYVNSTTPILNFHTHFSIENPVEGAEYFIIDFGGFTKSETHEITIKASQAYNNSEEIENDVILKTKLTLETGNTEEPGKDTTTIIEIKADKQNYTGSITEFKSELGWTNSQSVLTVENVGKFFDLINPVPNSTYTADISENGTSGNIKTWYINVKP
ncbi:MAG: hypothetical protein ACRC4M_02360, partial [Mycoplasma sp.]